MRAHDAKKIVKDKYYKETQFINNMQKTANFIQGINMINIDSQSFRILRILVKYFQFPILILFKPFFQRIEADKLTYINEFDDDLKSMGSIALAIMGDRKFPNLCFYSKAGYNPELMESFNLPKIEKMENFMDFVSQIDKQIDQIHSFQPKKEEGKIKLIKQKLSNYRLRTKVNVMQDLCLLAYQQILEQKQVQIKSELKKKSEMLTLPPISSQQSSNKSSNIIPIEKGKQIKQINDPNEAPSFLCCRTYFYFNQIIEQPETMVQEYKNYEYPYNEYIGQILMKTICGFLNVRGGIIYIGIKEKTQTFKRTVLGHTYNEGQKEEVHKYFRRICQRISPDIVNNPFYKLEYVPVRDSEGKYNFMQGRYIIRLRIMKGQQKELYSFSDYEKNDYFAFRTANEVLVRKIGQEILETYRVRLQQKQEESFSHHSGPCRIPEQGKFSYDSRAASSNMTNQSNRPYLKQKQKCYEELNPRNANIKNETFFIVDQKHCPLFSKYYPVKHLQKIALLPSYQQQERQILTIITSNKLECMKASFILQFQEESYPTIVDILNQQKILCAAMGDRRSIRFQKIEEVMATMTCLSCMGIKYSFLQ